MKYFLPFLVALFLFSPFLITPAAQDSWNIDLLGEAHPFVEQAFDVSMAGPYAYLSSGTGSGLRVLDLSDPDHPAEVSCAVNDDVCPDVPMWMTDRIRVSGDRVYLLLFDGTWSFEHFRLSVYDVSEPCDPRQLGLMSLPDNCSDLFVSGGHVYVTAEGTESFSGVKVIDVSDPMEPSEVGSFQTPGMAQSIWVEDDRAYIADGSALLIYDLTDPAAPVFLGSYVPPGETAFVQWVAAHQGYILVIDAPFGLRVLDVSDPSQIAEVGSLPHGQNDALFSPLVISGDYGHYLQDGDLSGKQLITLDLSDATDPQILGRYDMPGPWWCYGFDCCDGIACVAGGMDGLRVVDVLPPDSAAQIGHYRPYRLTSGLAVAGHHAFVGTYLDDLVVFDCSDPSTPVEVASLEFPESPIKRLSVCGQHLYVPGVIVGGSAGVAVLDIADPAAPQQIAYWPAPTGYSGLPFNVERYGDYALVACAIGGVEVYDVSQIDLPVALDRWTLWSPANQEFAVTNVKVSWPYVFAPDRAYGLYVLDVSDPTNIIEAASCPTPGDAMWLDISADHGHVFIADADGGLRIIDVSDPLAPHEVGSYSETLEMAVHVTVSGDSVYIADGGPNGLHVIDVSDPTDPVEVAWHRTPGVSAHDVALSDGQVCLLDMTHLEILQVTEPTAVQETSEPAVVIPQARICRVAPNPFNASSRIVFDLPRADWVNLAVYNVTGQRVRTLADGRCPAGEHACVFRAEDLASGIYFIRLEAGEAVDTKKAVLVK